MAIETEAKSPYKSIIDEVIKSGVPQGRELFEALNDLFAKPNRWVVVDPKTNGHQPNSEE